MMVFSVSNKSANQLAETIRTVDPLQVCAKVIRASLDKHDFGLEDSFCDGQDLKLACCDMNILAPILRFFGYLFNFDPETYPKAAKEVITQQEHSNDLTDDGDGCEDDDNLFHYQID